MLSGNNSEHLSHKVWVKYYIIFQRRMTFSSHTDIRTHMEKLNEDILASHNLGNSISKMIQRALHFLEEDSRCFEAYCGKYVDFRQSNPERFLLFDPGEDAPRESLDDHSDENDSDGSGSHDGLSLGGEIRHLNFGSVDETDGDLSAIKRGSSLDKRKIKEIEDNPDEIRSKTNRKKTKRIISSPSESVSGGGGGRL